MLTALELARQARIAANRAYLAGLQLGPDAMSKGQVRPLQVGDPVVVAAARQLATSAALTQAKNQVSRQSVHASHDSPDDDKNRQLACHSQA